MTASPRHSALCTAIEGRRLLDLIYEGDTLTVEPYAVHSPGDSTFLYAVIILSSDPEYLGWGPRNLDLARVSEVRDRGETFLPNGSFVAENLTGMICAVVL